MAEINQAGYQSIRDFIQANWRFIEVKNGGTVIFRISTTDPRVSWSHAPGSQTLELSVALKGSNADLPLPTTVNATAIYEVASGGSVLSEGSFTNFTFENTEDELLIRHQIQVPQV